MALLTALLLFTLLVSSTNSLCGNMFLPPPLSTPASYLLSIGVSTSTVSHIAPSLGDLHKTVVPAVEYLEGLYGKGVAEAIDKNPELLLTKGLQNATLQVSLLRNLSPTAPYRRLPRYLTSPPCAKPLSSLLLSNSFTPPDLEKIYRRSPSILTLRPPSADATLGYLLSVLGPAKLRAVVTKHPWILGLTVSNLSLTHSYLSASLGLGPEKATAILHKQPTVYGVSLDGNLRPTVERIQVRHTFVSNGGSEPEL